MNKWIIRGERQIDALITNLRDLSKDRVLEVTVKNHSTKRSLSANSLYWMWMSEMSKKFTSNGNVYTRDNMHDMMSYLYLNTVDIFDVNRNIIGAKTVSTSKLSSIEFCEYMNKIEAWAIDHDCYLTQPMHSEYAKYREAR